MDRLDSLTNTISTMSFYDIRAMYNQAKNAVLNISEMEAKVKEATNDEPWGASSTLMQEIAQGTFNFQTFNEVMPCIYGRFMEKEARQWRQIYKALQLLEYLVRHGSERVVDDARSHISTLKMLRNFHYIDDKGKDEGQNVRNRARELVELLTDVETIRIERRKAKANRGKYTGTGNDTMSFTSGGRYGGFGNDSLGGGGYYGDRLSGRGDDYYSGGSSGGFRDNNGRRDFEEYTAGDDEAVTRKSSVSRSNGPSRSTAAGSSSRAQTTPAPVTPQQKEPEVDLLGGFDDAPGSTAPSTITNTSPNKALPALSGFDDDDFADFQAAPSAPSPASPPAARATLMDMLNSSAPMARPPASTVNPTPQAQRTTSPPSFNAPLNPLVAVTNNRPSQSFAATMSPMPAQNTLWTSSQPLSPATSTPVTRTPIAAASNKAPASGAAPSVPAKGLSGFEDLWSMSLSGSSASTTAKSTTAGKSIKDLEKERAHAGIWAISQKPSGATGSATNMGLGNAFGNFGSAKAGETTGGGDDLLL
ncbi:hypothetical protein L210DRAFT_3502784 [Boletus edulis BED1]|uniref:ENTH domain-containing protein n=1 Tax=Boletus edulis BED1 TaxID=1328754 RepID=A0AAD4BXH6_BOLED|nr:hypothetical protein L210DRAFT_3502784 [Boletus edulis BED1]